MWMLRSRGEQGSGLRIHWLGQICGKATKRFLDQVGRVCDNTMLFDRAFEKRFRFHTSDAPRWD